MREVLVYHVDAFTDRRFGGNPAGVVPDATSLTHEDMQNIARELNLSETAFLVPDQPSGGHRIRYFTPTSEIDFCGHATIGTSWVLATEYGWKTSASGISFHTNVGVIPVEWVLNQEGDAETVFMRQVPPRVRSTEVSPDEIARIVGIHVSDIDANYPIRLAYTGNWHLLVPVRSRTAIDAAQPHLNELAEMNMKQQAATTHLFTFAEDGDPYDMYTRDFGPAVGIPEDPVTGAANGALAGYLVLEGILNAEQTHSLRMAQGHAMGRPGMVLVNIVPGDAPQIRVGGAAVITVTGRLRLD
ncbi:PhzF family phenazine biosynthesis protein [Alicyclobacillus macrosporangiidus]|uniref:Phenazine biosynthesis protein PhzF family n=1 Tax=Alicyclobacillus macrosporangiidus TaxID=392015 RepID=A0A1I7IVW0_9BACL|nr:PhzF family phenazine biosynthesis protein [Alicyclobacillus macrosporangiidus]SFU77087.1 phenazine biosynthesis protein PhzF family [Alicyclobacillus macrosporangiidus]